MVAGQGSMWRKSRHSDFWFIEYGILVGVKSSTDPTSTCPTTETWLLIRDHIRSRESTCPCQANHAIDSSQSHCSGHSCCTVLAIAHVLRGRDLCILQNQIITEISAGVDRYAPARAIDQGCSVEDGDFGGMRWRVTGLAPSTGGEDDHQKKHGRPLETAC